MVEYHMTYNIMLIWFYILLGEDQLAGPQTFLGSTAIAEATPHDVCGANPTRLLHLLPHVQRTRMATTNREKKTLRRPGQSSRRTNRMRAAYQKSEPRLACHRDILPSQGWHSTPVPGTVSATSLQLEPKWPYATTNEIANSNYWKTHIL